MGAPHVHHRNAGDGQLFSCTRPCVIAVPTGVKVFNWLATMWRGSLTFETPMTVRGRFIFVFTDGRLHRPDPGHGAGRIQLQDTY